MPKTIAPSKRILNWTPSRPDHRDFVFRAPRVARAALPRIKDLRRWNSPVEDQGAIGSCVGNAVAGAIELLDVKGAKVVTDISRLFIYYEARAMQGWENEDSGSYIRDAIKVCNKVGAADETIWPYIERKFSTKPSAAAYADAAARRFGEYSRITTLDDMLGCLAAGFPFVFGFTCYDEFIGEKVAKSGVLYMPGKSERPVGGHAVLAVGYNRSRERFLVRNSWGAGWGRKGYFSIPFEYVADPNLAGDVWTIRGQ